MGPLSEDEMTGYRHLARFTADGREMQPAIAAFLKAGRRDMLGGLLRIARRFGLLAPVTGLRKIGRSFGWSELDPEDFGEWFRASSALWFDTYVDRGRGVGYIRPEDHEALLSACAEAFVSPRALWSDLHARVQGDAAISPLRKALILALAEERTPIAPLVPDPRSDVEARFEEFCETHGIVPLRLLQEGRVGLDACSWVWMARDNDGICKIFKEMLPSVDDRLGPRSGEDEIYARLHPRGEAHPFTPGWYGIERFRGHRFGRQSICFGQTLTELLRHGPLKDDEAASIVARLADDLNRAHARGVLHLDLRPENVLVHDRRTWLLDFDGAQIMSRPGRTVDAGPQDPAFTPPETLLRLEASETSDVFQLGLLWHLLATGRPAFSETLPDRNIGRADALERHALPNALRDLVKPQRLSAPQRDVLDWMLAKDPEDRPTMAQVSDMLRDERSGPIPHRPRARSSDDRPAALFPARMGIPHRGHIEYMARVLELGYRLVISLECAYTITELDPIPKWDVMKMTALSLFDRGWGPEDVSFVFTPLYETEEELRMHYAMMPGIERVGAVASGNPDVHALFRNHVILDQRAVFGSEGMEDEIRSWGERLRTSVREGRCDRFHDLAASGVKRIMDFGTLHARYARDPVLRVPGAVRAALEDERGATLVEGRVRRYLSPVESLVRLAGEQGRDAALIDPFAPDDVIRLDGKTRRIRHVASVFDGKDLSLRFRLLAEEPRR